MDPPPLVPPAVPPLLAAPLAVPVPLLDPPVVDPPPHGPQIPCVLPAGMEHDVPGQQSAVVLQAPHDGTHALPKQAKGGLPPGLGTHGAPLQQSALDAQDAPASTHCEKAHRGTPTLSCRQVSSWQLPEQQLQVSLHDIWSRRQTSPLGLQPIGSRHTPTVDGAVTTHVTGLLEPPAMPLAPQQSPSWWQRSPTGWQPLAGWQTRTPVGPQGAHARLQHPPPHWGKPLSR